MAESIEIQLPFDIEKMTEEIRKFEFGPKRINCTFQCMCEEGFKSFVFGREETNKQIRCDKMSSVSSDSCSSSMDSIPFSRALQSSLKETSLSTQVKGEGLKLSFDVHDYKVDELTVKVVNNTVIIEGQSKSTESSTSQVYRNFVRKFTIPDICDKEKIVSTITSSGELKVWIPAKEGLPRSSTDRVAEMLKHGVVVNGSVESLEDLESQLSKNSFERIVEIKRVADRQRDVDESRRIVSDDSSYNTSIQSNESNLKIKKTAEYRRQFEKTKQTSKDWSDEERCVDIDQSVLSNRSTLGSNRTERIVETQPQRCPQETELEVEQTSENKVDVKRSGYTKKIVEESTKTKKIINGVASQSQTHERTVEFQKAGSPAKVLEESRTTSNKVESVQDVNKKVYNTEAAKAIVSNSLKNHMEKSVHASRNRSVDIQSEETVSRTGTIESSDVQNERIVDIKLTGVPEKIRKDKDILVNQVTSKTNDVEKAMEQVVEVKKTKETQDNEVERSTQEEKNLPECKQNVKKEVKEDNLKEAVEETVTKKMCQSELEEKFVKSCNDIITELKQPEVHKENRPDDDVEIESVKSASEETEFFSQVKRQVNTYRKGSINEGIVQEVPEVHQIKVVRDWDNDVEIESVHSLDERSVDGRQTGEACKTFVLVEEKPEYDSDVETIKSFQEDIVDVKTKKQSEVSSKQETIELEDKQEVNKTQGSNVGVVEDNKPSPKVWSETKKEVDASKTVDQSNVEITKTRDFTENKERSEHEHHKKEVQTSTERTLEIRQTGVPHNKSVEENKTDRLVEIKQTGLPQAKTAGVVKKEVHEENEVIISVPKNTEIIVEIKQTKVPKDHERIVEVKQTDEVHKTSNTSQTKMRKEFSTEEKVVEIKQTNVPHRSKAELEEEISNRADERNIEIKQTNVPHKTVERQTTLEVEKEQVSNERVVEVKKTGQIHQTSKIDSSAERVVEIKQTGVPQKSSQVPEQNSNERLVKVGQVNATHNNVKQTKFETESTVDSNERLVQIQQTGQAHKTTKKTCTLLEDERLVEMKQAAVPQTKPNACEDVCDTKINVVKESSDRVQKINQTSGFQKTVEIERKSAYNNGVGYDECTVEVTQTGMPSKTTNSTDVFEKKVDKKQTMENFDQTTVPRKVTQNEVSSNETTFEIQRNHRTQKTSQEFEKTFKKDGNVEKTMESKERVVEIRQTGTPSKSSKSTQIKSDVSSVNERLVEVKQTGVPRNTNSQSVHGTTQTSSNNERLVEIKKTGEFRRNSEATTKRSDNFASKKFTNSFDDHMSHINKTLEQEFGSEHLTSLNEHLEDFKQSAESLRQSVKTDRLTNAFEDHFTNSRTKFDSIGKRLGSEIESEIKKTVNGFSSKLENELKAESLLADSTTFNAKQTGATPKVYTRSEVSTQETEIRNRDFSNKHSYQLHENGVLKESVTGSEQSSHVYPK